MVEKKKLDAKKQIKRNQKSKQKKSKHQGRQKKKVEQPSLSHELKKIVTGLTILVFVVATAAMVFDFYLSKKPCIKKVSEKQFVHKDENITRTDPWNFSKDQNKSIGVKKPLSFLKGKSRKDLKENIHTKPVFEIFDNATHTSKREQKIVTKEDTPRVAIIIDDIGFDRKMASAFSELDRNITLSILPGAPFGRAVAESLHEKGSEIMLHLPMEPVQYPNVDPGPGAILADMTPDQLLWQLRKNLDALPYVKGVNNHMGSRITSLSAQMHQIFTVLKQRDLFFIDSMTSRKSLCRTSASLLQIPFGQRDIFLDNIQESEYIKKQIQKLVKVAQRHGTAIGIGHPYDATYAALKEVLPDLKTKICIVPASTLVAIPG